MREIFCRGKRIDNGEWAYGVPLTGNTSGVYMLWMETESKNTRDGSSVRDVVKQSEVIPETVGQYTGLKDKNGEQIFEGDIIRCTRGCPHEVYFKQEYGGSFIGGMPAFYLKGIREGYAWTGSEEVIANIHDNPKLLGVE